MRRKVLMSLLITRVFGDEMKIFATDDKGAVHLCRDNGAGEDPTTNRHKTCKWAFLVYQSEAWSASKPAGDAQN